MTTADSGYIRRAAHTRNFTVVNNSLIRDKRLDRRTRMLLIEMLSYPPDTRITMAMLLDGGTEGRDALRVMISKLTEAGYVTRARQRSADGRWTWETTVSEDPQAAAPSPENASMVPPAETPVCAGRTIDALAVDGSAVDKDLKTEDLKTIKTSEAAAPPEGPGTAPDSPQMIRLITNEMRTHHRREITPGQARIILRDIAGRAKETPDNWFQFVATAIRREQHVERWLPTNQPDKFTAPTTKPDVSAGTMADVRARLNAIRAGNAERRLLTDPVPVGSTLQEAAA